MCIYTYVPLRNQNECLGIQIVIQKVMQLNRNLFDCIFNDIGYCDIFASIEVSRAGADPEFVCGGGYVSRAGSKELLTFYMMSAGSFGRIHK